MKSPLNLTEQFEKIHEYWSPKVIGEVNDQYVKIAKLKGEFIWHDHQEEDELFYIVKGSLELELEEQVIRLNEGDVYIVPKTIRHKPFAQEECWVMLVENKSTKHTGEVHTERTKNIKDQLSQDSDL